MELKQLAFQVNDLLTQYIAIHDDIFAHSWRKVIPIPGIFKKIDYCHHEAVLSAMLFTLEGYTSDAADLQQSPRGPSELAQALVGYTTALHTTLEHLHGMCSKLCSKSRGKAGYDLGAYNRDFQEYERLRTVYSQWGEALNQAFRRAT